MKKSILITGANGGIGRATCDLLASQGYQIIALCRTEDEAKSMPYTAYACDLTDTQNIKKVFEKITSSGNRLYGLVNNAGVYLAKSWDTISEQDFAHTFDINVRALFFLSSLFSQHLISREESGVIINISSVSAHIGSIDPAYAGSKAAVVSIGKSMAKALAPHCIRIITLCPGPIETKMGETIPTDRKEKYKETIPMKRFGQPGEVATIIAFALSDQASYLTGTTINVDGGLV